MRAWPFRIAMNGGFGLIVAAMACDPKRSIDARGVPHAVAAWDSSDYPVAGPEGGIPPSNTTPRMSQPQGSSE